MKSSSYMCEAAHRYDPGTSSTLSGGTGEYFMKDSITEAMFLKSSQEYTILILQAEVSKSKNV